MNTNRKKLAALLEEYGGSLESFQKLRSDAYEKALAGQSLERLEHLYCELFRPGQTLEQTVKTAPPWPPGTKLAGDQPSTGLLSNISTRFNTEIALSGLGPTSRFLDLIKAKAAKLPVGQHQDVLGAVITLVGDELIKGKMKGQPLAAQLEVIDRLQYQERTALKEREVANREKAMALLLKKYEDEREKCKAVTSNDSLTPEEKQQRYREILGMV